LFLAAHGATAAEIGVVAGLYPVVWGAGQIWTGHWSDRVGRKPLIVAGMLVQSAALALLAASDGGVALAAVSAVGLGVGTALVYRGHSGARESVGFYRSLFDDLRFDIDDQVGEGDKVATRWTLHGSYRGRAITLHGIVISRFRDGRIIEDHSVTDSLELPRAL